MVQLYRKWDKILELFYEYPYKRFSIREISKKTGIPSSSIQRYLKGLKKEDLISENNQANITPYFKFIKTYFIIEKMHKVGLVDYLEKMFVPETIILFGGVRKGEYDSESDIDLFISSTKKPKLELENFEKKLGHKIQLFVEKDIKDLPPHLLNNVVNGIKLRGYFKIK